MEPGDQIDYQKFKREMQKEFSKERELQKLEERTEDCILKLEHWQTIFEGWLFL
jgi:hypothetical protein